MSWSDILVNGTKVSASFVWSTLNRITQWVLPSDASVANPQQDLIPSPRVALSSRCCNLGKNQRKRSTGLNKYLLLLGIIASAAARATSQSAPPAPVLEGDIALGFGNARPSNDDGQIHLDDNRVDVPISGFDWWEQKYNLCAMLNGERGEELACVSQESMPVEEPSSGAYSRRWNGVYYDFRTLTPKQPFVLLSPPGAEYDPEYPPYYNRLLRVSDRWIIAQQDRVFSSPVSIKTLDDWGNSSRMIHLKSVKILDVIQQDSGITVFTSTHGYSARNITVQFFTADLMPRYSKDLLIGQRGTTKLTVLFASLPGKQGFAMLTIGCLKTPSSLRFYDPLGNQTALFQRDDLCFLTHRQTVASFAISRSGQVVIVAREQEAADDEWLLLLSNNFSEPAFNSLRQLYISKLPQLFSLWPTGFLVPGCLSSANTHCGLYALGVGGGHVFETVLAGQPLNYYSVGTASVLMLDGGQLALIYRQREQEGRPPRRVDINLFRAEKLSAVVLSSEMMEELSPSHTALVLLGGVGGVIITLLSYLMYQKFCQTKKQGSKGCGEFFRKSRGGAHRLSDIGVLSNREEHRAPTLEQVSGAFI